MISVEHKKLLAFLCKVVGSLGELDQRTRHELADHLKRAIAEKSYTAFVEYQQESWTNEGGQ